MPKTRMIRTTTAKISRAERDGIQFRLRLENSGKWVAWSEDGLRVVAATDEFETLREAARQAGFDQFIVEWLPPLDQARFGGAAL